MIFNLGIKLVLSEIQCQSFAPMKWLVDDMYLRNNMWVRSTKHGATFPVMTSVVLSMSSTSPSVVNTTGLRSRRRNGLDMFTLRRYYNSDLYVYYGTISPIINSFVLLLNVLLIATIIRGKFRTSTYIKIIAISICDSLSGLVPLPFNVYVFGLKNEMGYLSLPWCYLFDFLQMILPKCSICHLCIWMWDLP